MATASLESNGTMAANESVAAPPIFVAPYATIAVKSHVPVTLELKRPNFNRWSPFFLSLCGKFGLRSHVDGSTAARPQDAQWAIADSCVHSWLLGSVADDVLGLALAPDQTAHQLWVAINALFQANKASRAVIGLLGITSIPGDIWRNSLQFLDCLEISDCEGLLSIGEPEAIAQINNVDIDKCPMLNGLEQPFWRGDIGFLVRDVNQVVHGCLMQGIGGGSMQGV